MSDAAFSTFTKVVRFVSNSVGIYTLYPSNLGICPRRCTGSRGLCSPGALVQDFKPLDPNRLLYFNSMFIIEDAVVV